MNKRKILFLVSLFGTAGFLALLSLALPTLVLCLGLGVCGFGAALFVDEFVYGVSDALDQYGSTDT